MITTPNKAEIEESIITLPIPETNQEFNWRNCWYPVTFLQDLPKDRPYSFSLYDEPLVLFRNQDGKLGCLTDRCSHRAAKLSDGQIIDGKIECLYHGWQFGADGQCLHIPQLAKDAKIPNNACVKSFVIVERQGIVWVWAGEPETADEKRLPILPEFDNPELVFLDTMYDRPYDQDFCIENFFDPAHFPISHHGSESNRDNAQPLEIEVIKTSYQGIQGRYRNTNKSNQNWINLDFFAPSLFLYQFCDTPKSGFYIRLALYSLPLGKGRCRVLSRLYSNYSTWKIKLQPRWVAHLYRNRVTEEDMYFIRGAQVEVERLGKNLKELYLPLKTSDTLVIEYRKWLDKYGSSLPFYQGFSSSKSYVLNENTNITPIPIYRLEGHTKICSSCNQAYQVTNLVKQTLIGVAIALAALAILTDNSWVSPVAIAASLLAVALALVAQNVKTRFERPYTRYSGSQLSEVQEPHPQPPPRKR